METQTIGQFIAALRKEQHLTQRELAEDLHITDKAVSKWERGLSCPDIALLPALAKRLGVTAGELLEGKRSAPPPREAEELVDKAIGYAEKSVRARWHTVRKIGAWSITLGVLIAILTCTICDLAINGGITWGRYPITACVFAWLIVFPALYAGTRGILLSLAALTLFILPFLYLLECYSGVRLMGIAVPTAIISLGYLWAGYGLWKGLPVRRWLGGGIFLLLGVAVSLLINLTVAMCIDDTPFLDAWDWLTAAVLAAGGGVCIWRDRKRKSRP